MPPLKPETSFGYEAGMDQKLLGGALTGGVTWFHNDIRNLITSGPAPTFQNINIGRARTQGVESLSGLEGAGDADLPRRLYLYRRLDADDASGAAAAAAPQGQPECRLAGDGRSEPGCDACCMWGRRSTAIAISPFRG